MNQVRQQREVEEKNFNVTIRNYSSNVLGYRVNIYGEYHYIINEMYISDIAKIFSVFTNLDSKYDDYGFVMLQDGYRIFIEKSYMFSKRLGRCVLSNNEYEKIISLAEYKNRKGLIARFNNIRSEANHHE